MNSHVRRFYRKFVDEETPVRFYNDVIALHEAPSLGWEEINRKVSSLPKGWYELAQLTSKDRIEFVRDHWISSLPFDSHIHDCINTFFSKLDDIGVFVTQARFESPYECEIVYSMSDESSFFHGLPPSKVELGNIKAAFKDVLPEDYLSFLKIHNGFSKHSDTGIITAKYLLSVYEKLQEKIQNEVIYSGSKLVEPKDLVPFYESFGQPSFQCFYLGWAPQGNCGNVFYSMAEGKVSDIFDKKSWAENLAFPTFLDWLVFYLEGVEV